MTECFGLDPFENKTRYKFHKNKKNNFKSSIILTQILAVFHKVNKTQLSHLH